MMKKKRYAKAAFIIYMIVLIMITAIRPWPIDFRFMGGRLNLSLFADYRIVIQESIPRFIYLFFGNIIWFMPFGYYFVACRKKPILTTVIMGFALSLSIEVMQFVLGTGASEVDDLVLNTLGCFIGSVAAQRRKREEI